MVYRRILGSLVAVLLLGAGAGGVSASPFPQLLEPGDPAPRFRVEDMQSGETMDFERIAPSQPLLLVFLQTACRSCVREMLAIKTIREELGGFGVLGVFLDMHWGNQEVFVREYELPFVFAWDPSETIARQYGVSVSPVAFLLDRKRKIVAVYPGFVVGVERYMRRDIERFL